VTTQKISFVSEIITSEPAPASGPVAEALDVHEDGQKSGLLNLEKNSG